jgi:hypothetical protein
MDVSHHYSFLVFSLISRSVPGSASSFSLHVLSLSFFFSLFFHFFLFFPFIPFLSFHQLWITWQGPFSRSNLGTGTMSPVHSLPYSTNPVDQLLALWRHLCPHLSLYNTPFILVAFFLDTWPLKMGLIGSPETLVLNQPTLCNIPQDERIYYEKFAFIVFCVSIITLQM